MNVASGKNFFLRGLVRDGNARDGFFFLFNRHRRLRSLALSPRLRFLVSRLDDGFPKIVNIDVFDCLGMTMVSERRLAKIEGSCRSRDGRRVGLWALSQPALLWLWRGRGRRHALGNAIESCSEHGSKRWDDGRIAPERLGGCPRIIPPRRFLRWRRRGEWEVIEPAV
jgi:hypothetical protein